MSSRTQIVCSHEGVTGNTDSVFINRLIKSLDPAWIRPVSSSVIRLVPCGGRQELIDAVPVQLAAVASWRADTTLMVWADIDDKLTSAEQLKDKMWKACEAQNIARDYFDRIVFVFAKDRIENWIQYLTEGETDENVEGLRVTPAVAAPAAKKLASVCRSGKKVALPPSLEWSCKNWRALVTRMNA